VYEVYLEQSAERDLKKLPVEIFDQVIAAIKSLAGNSRPTGCRKMTRSKNDWRIKIDNYRVVYEIDEKAKEIRIMMIKHRKEIYKRL
jgi:mRNA interferase RelE/StbE